MGGADAPLGLADREAEEILAFWQRCQWTTPRPKVTDSKRREVIRQRLAGGCTKAHLLEAINGVRWSPWHQGDNEHGKPFTDIPTLFKSREHVDKHRMRQPSPEQQAEFEAERRAELDLRAGTEASAKHDRDQINKGPVPIKEDLLRIARSAAERTRRESA